MGIFLCLLDGKYGHPLLSLTPDRPHLHPTLQALHAHRLRAHQLALPADPARDVPAGQGTEWTAWRLTDEEVARRASYLPHA
jgi:hypothetical protein